MARVALFLLASVVVASTADAQILNTLSGFEHRPGWQGQASAFLHLSGGNTEQQNYLVNAAGQWEADRNRVRLIASYDFAKTSGVENQDDIKLHLRHNFRLTPHVSSPGLRPVPAQSLSATRGARPGWCRASFQPPRGRQAEDRDGRFGDVRDGRAYGRERIRHLAPVDLSRLPARLEGVPAPRVRGLVPARVSRTSRTRG